VGTTWPSSSWSDSVFWTGKWFLATTSYPGKASLGPIRNDLFQIRIRPFSSLRIRIQPFNSFRIEIKVSLKQESMIELLQTFKKYVTGICVEFDHFKEAVSLDFLFQAFL
jgi:hypothetical protein